MVRKLYEEISAFAGSFLVQEVKENYILLCMYDALHQKSFLLMQISCFGNHTTTVSALFVTMFVKFHLPFHCMIIPNIAVKKSGIFFHAPLPFFSQGFFSGFFKPRMLKNTFVQVFMLYNSCIPAIDLYWHQSVCGLC